MINLKGQFNTAKVFSDNLDSETLSQIKDLLNQDFVEKLKIRIMSDAHAGKGCTIGTTMTIIDKVVPNHVGVDIGCGMETTVLSVKSLELSRLDEIIKRNIPVSTSIRKTIHPYMEKVNLEKLKIANKLNLSRAYLSMGSLGGGNHFIEVEKDDEGILYLIVHSGSRNIGKEVCEYYQKLAVDLHKTNKKVNSNMAYLYGTYFDDYLFDMNLIQQYANWNRKAITEIILKEMKIKKERCFTTIHNYIDLNDKILRKGAISAKLGEEVLIPMNMKDGSLLCEGLGNEDWNYSAPHGAGRLLSRSKARETLNVNEFKNSMVGIYTTTANKSTIDEAPLAYKPVEEIIYNTKETVIIKKVLKPIYNFKASE